MKKQPKHEEKEKNMRSMKDFKEPEYEYGFLLNVSNI